MDSLGGSGVPSGAAQSPQWISTCSREKENQERMDVRLPKNMADELGLKQTETKLVLTLQDKKNYVVVHYRNLKFYLNRGMQLKKVHRVLKFEKECWMEPYIRMNTEFRKQAKNEFEKNFYKLMNNSVCGKTMENVRKRVNVKIVCSDEKEKTRKLIANPLFAGCAFPTILLVLECTRRV